jgi:hypothetical protein
MPLEPRALAPNEKFDFELPADTFVDPDLGDVLRYHASVEGQRGLPGWLEFDAETLRFRGTVPLGAGPETALIVRATDFDGAWAEARLVLQHDFLA